MDLPELELLVEPDNPHSPGHSFTALENSALLASSESSPHLSLIARTPTMSQDDSAPTELRYTASIEPQVAFPCYFGTHDGYAYQDWYVPAVVLTGTASPSLRDSPLVPFSCQGPAYVRIYPTPYLNELRRDAIAADFEIPTASATHSISSSLTPSSLPDLVYPPSAPTSSISSTPPLASSTPILHYDTAADDFSSTVSAPDEPRFNVPATIIAPIPVPANDLSTLRSFQAECERVLVGQYEHEDSTRGDGGLKRHHDELEDGHVGPPRKHVKNDVDHVEHDPFDDVLDRLEAQTDGIEYIQHVTPSLPYPSFCAQDIAHERARDLLGLPRAYNFEQTVIDPLPPLLLSFYTAPTATSIPQSTRLSDDDDDDDDVVVSTQPSPIFDIADFPLPLSPEHTTPRPVTPATTPSSSPDIDPFEAAQRREYERLFDDGEVREFVENVLLEAMQDATSELCEFFREEFAVFHD
ncbi:hypothetical protein L226DRAFT_575344 [Lentinus tigrinus ALCF2SS1-7]|uniref:uncharacterized protein n=1 Tax=Lentinus tigrinus ALCF2SS1-7 TaxID=1328758 RepID=UPI0011660CAE|nr:hypothetical protein L226DRAFT_575344 [Lentinus tigrinus ALCF2SS1-7]